MLIFFKNVGTMYTEDEILSSTFMIYVFLGGVKVRRVSAPADRRGSDHGRGCNAASSITLLRSQHNPQRFSKKAHNEQ